MYIKVKINFTLETKETGEAKLATSAEDKINSIMIKCLIGRVNCNSGIYQFVCSGPATPCSEILVEIKVPTDTYPAETTWSLSNQCGIVRGMSGGPFSSENKY